MGLWAPPMDAAFNCRRQWMPVHGRRVQQLVLITQSQFITLARQYAAWQSPSTRFQSTRHWAALSSGEQRPHDGPRQVGRFLAPRVQRSRHDFKVA